MTEEIPGTTPGDVEGYQPPAEGEGDVPPSEIPTGVDALPAEAVAAAEERGGDGGDDGALDISGIVAEGGDDADAGAAGAAEGGAADETGEDAPEMTDPEAQVAPDTGEA